jgi:dihydroxyacetone kinase DhaKLM complex PTS-EIIA-like component DhaM
MQHGISIPCHQTLTITNATSVKTTPEHATVYRLVDIQSFRLSTEVASYFLYADRTVNSTVQKTVLFDKLVYIALAACKLDIKKTTRTLDKMVEILLFK